MAATGHDNLGSLQALTGYNLIRQGNDYVVLDDDPKLRESRPVFLSVGAAIDLHGHEVGKSLSEAVNSVEIDLPEPLPTQIGVVSDLGFLSRLDRATRAFFFSPETQLEKIINSDVLPLMSELQMEKARHVTVDLNKFYGRVSISKLSFLIEELGLQNAQEAVFGKQLLHGILPTPLEPPELFHALLLFPPYVAAFALQRPGTSLVFYPSKFHIFDYRLFDALPNYLIPDLSHLQAKGLKAQLNPAIHFAGEAEELLLLAASVTNSYWDFFTKPLNWLGSDGELDQLRQIKAMSLGRLFVTDLLAVQQTSSPFAGLRLCFQFFDKLAGLCVEYNNPNQKNRSQTEAKWASHLIQPDMLDLVTSIFSYQYKTQKKRIYKLLAHYACAINAGIKRDLRQMHSQANIPQTQETVAECMRLIRNFAHGTFLGGGKFEKLLLKMNPVTPVDIHHLPWLYLMAFGLDPDYFLKEAVKLMEKTE